MDSDTEAGSKHLRQMIRETRKRQTKRRKGLYLNSLLKIAIKRMKNIIQQLEQPLI